MSQLPLSDILVGLRNVLGQEALLRTTGVGTAYLPRLHRVLADIEALPPALTRNRPYGDALRVADRTHDALINGIWHIVEAYLDLEDVAPEAQKSARHIREGVVPDRKAAKGSYAAEVAAAAVRKLTIETHRQDLEAIPVAGGKSLLTWAELLQAQAAEIESLLGQRGEAVVTQENRAQAMALRSEAQGTASRMRAALEDEVAGNPALPGDLPDRIFATWDELEALAEARRGESGSGEPPPGAASTGIEEAPPTP